MGIPTLRACHFEASENIVTKFKSQVPHVKRTKYQNAATYIGILPHKQTTLGEHFEPECSSKYTQSGF